MIARVPLRLDAGAHVSGIFCEFPNYETTQI